MNPLVMMPQHPMEGRIDKFMDHTFNLTKISEEIGFIEEYRITSPLVGSVQYQPYDVERAKKKKRMLNVLRDIVIFKT